MWVQQQVIGVSQSKQNTDSGTPDKHNNKTVGVVVVVFKNRPSKYLIDI